VIIKTCFFVAAQVIFRVILLMPHHRLNLDFKKNY
jgi:hypothetical protein